MSGQLDPVTLQVMLGGLRAVCEEMGAVLVRAAHSANIKERRDASTALFDAAGADGHAGRAHPRAPRRDAGRGRGSARRGARRGRHVDPERPLPRRHAPARHHPGVAAVSRRTPRRVRRHARASRRRWRRGARQHAGALPAPRAGGRRDPSHAASRAAGRSTRGMLDSLVARMRAPGPARGRPARAARGQPPRGAAHRGARGPARRRAARAVRWRRSCSTRSGARGRRSPRCRTGATARPTCSRTTAAGEPHDLRIDCEVLIAGDELTVDFAGTDPQSDGNLNCPLSVTKSAVYYVVRVLTDPDIPPSAGAYRPVHVTAPPGTRRERTRRRPRSPAATSRRRAASPTSRWRALGQAVAGACRGSGHDEQPDARQRAVHLLRDHRRRPGGVPRRRRPVGGARRDEQHAQHADRGARGGVPAAGASSTRCGADPAAPAATAAGTGSCGRSRRSSR